MTTSESPEPNAPDTDRSPAEPISIRRLDRVETTVTSNGTGE